MNADWSELQNQSKNSNKRAHKDFFMGIFAVWFLLDVFINLRQIKLKLNF